MAEPSLQGAAEIFEPLRPRLMRVAYRMLGSVSDAEDVVQEAFIRWTGVNSEEIREPEAFLRRVLTRLCLDQLKSAKRQREIYIGLWLPDPIVEGDEGEDVTLPLMLAMERLSPLERAAFLLHDVFGLGFDEVAARDERPRFKLEKQRGIELANAFYTASRSGDMSALGAMLAADVSVHADGGGKRPASLDPIFGFDEVMKLHAYLAKQFQAHQSKLVRTGFINGLPGFVTLEADGELQTTTLDIEDCSITAIYVVRNPDKLRHLH
jgi:RNA polymerase sigma-70 factor (ECF subfamily)